MAEALLSSQLLVFVYNSYMTCSEPSAVKETLHPAQSASREMAQEPCLPLAATWKACPPHAQHTGCLCVLICAQITQCGATLENPGLEGFHSSPRNAVPLWGRKKGFLLTNPNKVRIDHWNLVGNFSGFHIYLGNIIGGQFLCPVSASHSPGD